VPVEVLINFTVSISDSPPFLELRDV
jgi:hypothetical protein